MKRLGDLVESIAGVLLALVVVIVLLQVFGRYILRISLSWPEELARYVLVWLMIFGVAAAAASRSQIVVDTLLELVPASVRRALEALAALAGLVAVALLVWTSQPLIFGPPAAPPPPPPGSRPSGSTSPSRLAAPSSSCSPWPSWRRSSAGSAPTPPPPAEPRRALRPRP